MYYQKSRSIDDYLDEFVGLVVEAGYTDLKTTVVKFRKGLDPQIQNTIATMAYASPEDWYEAAKNIDQNWAANEAFKLAYQTPMPTSLCPIQQSLFKIPPTTHIHPTPGNPVPMDIDFGQKKNPTLLTCYRCHQPGHRAPDCPQRFDIRLLTVKELEMELMNRKDTLPKEILSMNSEHEIPEEEDFVQDNKWKARPHCPPITISKY